MEKHTASPESGAAETVRYAWSATGQLATVTLADGRRVDFAYDLFGRRLAKRVAMPPRPGVPSGLVATTRFIWDADVLVHELKEIHTGSGDPIIEERTYWFEEDSFVPMAHREVRREGGETLEGDWLHYLNDPAGTPERLVAPNGEVVCELQRSAWGRVAPAPGAKAKTPLRFLGQYEDDETGLFYNRFRYYDPDTGRYISHDPLGLDGGLNLYRYPENPHSHVDPLGLAGYCTCKITTRGGDTFTAKSGSGSVHHAEVQKAIDRDYTTANGKGKNYPQKKGQCAEPNAMTNYLNTLGVKAGDKKSLKKALRDIATIEPTLTKSGEPKDVCPYCRVFLRKLGGRKLLKKVKPASLIY